MLVRSGPLRLRLLARPPSPLSSSSSALSPASLRSEPICRKHPRRLSQRCSRACSLACASNVAAGSSSTAPAPFDSGFSGCGSMSAGFVILILLCKLTSLQVPPSLEEVQRPRYLEFDSPWCIAACKVRRRVADASHPQPLWLAAAQPHGYGASSSLQWRPLHIITPRAHCRTNRGATCHQWII